MKFWERAECISSTPKPVLMFRGAYGLLLDVLRPFAGINDYARQGMTARSSFFLGMQVPRAASLESNTHSSKATLTRSQILEVWGRCLSPNNGCKALPCCISRSSRAAALWRIQLQRSFKRWRVDQALLPTKTAARERQFPVSTAVRGRRFRKFYLVAGSSSTCL